MGKFPDIGMCLSGYERSREQIAALTQRNAALEAELAYLKQPPTDGDAAYWHTAYRVLEAEVERWRWVAHMVWSVLDPSPFDAKCYPLRLAEQWHEGLSYHDGQFHDAAREGAE